MLTFFLKDPKAFLKNEILDEEERAGQVDASFNIIVIIGMVAYVEMTLNWNSITSVHSLRETGQFMPLFIALAQLIATLYQVCKVGGYCLADEEALISNGKVGSFRFYTP